MMIKNIYFAHYDDDILLSNECLSKNKCGDSDWWFNNKNKTFNRFYTYHDEINGLQIVYEQLKGKKYKWRRSGCTRGRS